MTIEAKLLRHDLAFRSGELVALYLGSLGMDYAMFELEGVDVQCLVDSTYSESDPFAIEAIYIPLSHGPVQAETAEEVCRDLRAFCDAIAWENATAQVEADRQLTGLRFPYAFGHEAEDTEDRPHCSGCSLCLGTPSYAGM